MQERQEGAEKLRKEEMVSPITNGTQDLTLFRIGGTKKPPYPYQFFPCNFYKRRN